MVESAVAPSNKEINELIVELRFKPNARILDHRGSWAESLATHMELPHWQIVENRLDIFTKNRHQHVFLGFRNCGASYANVASTNLFIEKAQRFLRRLFTFPEFGDPVYVERLGVRTKVATAFAGPFDDLRNLFAKRYLRLGPATDESFRDASLVDIGAALNFKDDTGHFNSQSGPMPQSQLKEFFKRAEDLPETALYTDVDYWVKPERQLSSVEVLALTKQFALAADRRVGIIRDSVLRRDDG